MSRAIIPGSFDPMTLGHLWLIERVARDFDEVVIAVMINDSKQYMFDMQTRVEIARATVADVPGARVIADDGMLIDLFDRLEADAVCKGWRNESDFEYENQMAEWNHAHNPHFCTRLYRAEGEHQTLSSTEVREMMGQGASLAGCVHPNAISLIRDALGK